MNVFYIGNRVCATGKERHFRADYVNEVTNSTIRMRKPDFLAKKVG